MYKSCIHRQCCTFRYHVYWYLKPCILMFETTYIDVWNHVHWYLKPRILMFETTYIDIWNHVYWCLKPRTLIFETTYIDIWNYVYWCLKPRILTFETTKPMKCLPYIKYWICKFIILISVSLFLIQIYCNCHAIKYQLI